MFLFDHYYRVGPVGPPNRYRSMIRIKILEFRGLGLCKRLSGLATPRGITKLVSRKLLGVYRYNGKEHGNYHNYYNRIYMYILGL